VLAQRYGQTAARSILGAREAFTQVPFIWSAHYDVLSVTPRSGATSIVFDPLMLPAGIAPSDDPILHIRSTAYVESYTRRTGETKKPSAITPADVANGE